MNDVFTVESLSEHHFLSTPKTRDHQEQYNLTLNTENAMNYIYHT